MLIALIGIAMMLIGVVLNHIFKAKVYPYLASVLIFIVGSLMFCISLWSMIDK
jgi:hypothetical protein